MPLFSLYNISTIHMLTLFLHGEQKPAAIAMPIILVINKVDCAPFVSVEEFGNISSSFNKHVLTCAVTGKGIPELEKAVLEVRGLEPTAVGGRRWTINQVEIYIQDNECLFTLLLS